MLKSLDMWGYRFWQELVHCLGSYIENDRCRLVKWASPEDACSLKSDQVYQHPAYSTLNCDVLAWLCQLVRTTIDSFFSLHIAGLHTKIPTLQKPQKILGLLEDETHIASMANVHLLEIWQALILSPTLIPQTASWIILKSPGEQSYSSTLPTMFPSTHHLKKHNECFVIITNWALPLHLKWQNMYEFNTIYWSTTYIDDNQQFWTL